MVSQDVWRGLLLKTESFIIFWLNLCSWFSSLFGLKAIVFKFKWVPVLRFFFFFFLFFLGFFQGILQFVVHSRVLLDVLFLLIFVWRTESRDPLCIPKKKGQVFIWFEDFHDILSHSYSLFSPPIIFSAIYSMWWTFEFQKFKRKHVMSLVLFQKMENNPSYALPAQWTIH